MKRSSFDVVGLVLVAAALLVVLLAYPSLPAIIPVHWNARGVANGFMPKAVGAFILPGTMCGMWMLFALLPRIAPRGSELGGFLGAYAVIARACLAFFLYLTCVITFAALGKHAPLDVATLTIAGTGCLLAVLGNYLTKVRKNQFVGIRTPWTLANEEVWARTHRLGGRLFVVGGTFITVAALAGRSLVVLPTVLFMTVVLFGYSYVIYRRLESAPK